MANIKLIKDGKVANIIVADSVAEARKHGLVEGYDDAVIGEGGEIGHRYEGGKFIAPAPSQDNLYKHAAMRLYDDPWVTVELPGVGKVCVEDRSVPLLWALAAQARADDSLTVPWPQRPKPGYVVLGAKQIIALADALLKQRIDSMHAYKQTLDGIKSRNITTHDDEVGVDAVSRWPARYDDVYKA